MNSSENFSKKTKVNNLIRLDNIPELKKPTLFIIWERIPGKIGERVFEELNRNLNGEKFCEINPGRFYSLNGVEINDNIASIPYNRFYYIQRSDVLIFKGFDPQLNHYQFISAIIKCACGYLSVQEIYTLNSFLSFITYDTPRNIWAVYNGNGIKEKMKGYNLLDMNYEGPPATSSYLLWLARKREIPGMSLWCEIPSYLTLVDDFQSQKGVLQFLSKRFGIDLDLTHFDKLIQEQKNKLLNLRMVDKKVDQYLWSVENKILLSQEESLYLSNKIYEEFHKA